VSRAKRDERSSFSLITFDTSLVIVAVAVALVLLAALAVASDVMVEMLEELYQAFQDFLKE
jgi:hypothetical protein